GRTTLRPRRWAVRCRGRAGPAARAGAAAVRAVERVQRPSRVPVAAGGVRRRRGGAGRRGPLAPGSGARAAVRRGRPATADGGGDPGADGGSGPVAGDL